MALRVARGLFRLWLVLSVLWIGGAGWITRSHVMAALGVVTWQEQPLWLDGQPWTNPNDGKQYVYDETADHWLPVSEPPADRDDWGLTCARSFCRWRY